MTCRSIAIVALCLTLVSWPGTSQADDPPTAVIPGADVVAALRAARDAAAAAAAQRERRFENERDAARAELARNRGVLDQLERRHRRLVDALAEGESRLDGLETRLASGAEDERALYDAARLAARDMRAQLAGSLLNAQRPQRLTTLASIGSGSGPVAPEQVESLWLIALDDVTRAGRVTRFDTPADPGRASSTTTVTRIGTFAAFAADGTPTDWDTLSAALRGTARPGRAPAFDERLADVVIDPFGGSLSVLEAMRPGPAELIGQGGMIARIILALGALGVIVAAVRYVLLSRVAMSPSRPGPMQRLDGVYQRTCDLPSQDMVAALGDSNAGEAAALQRGQPLLKLLAALCPLLGLLGTVTAMIGLFRTIAIAGTGNPALTAGSVGQALVTTLLGIGAAVILILVHAAVSARSRRLVERLDERAAELVASHKAVRVAARTAQ